MKKRILIASIVLGTLILGALGWGYYYISRPEFRARSLINMRHQVQESNAIMALARRGSLWRCPPDKVIKGLAAEKKAGLPLLSEIATDPKMIVPEQYLAFDCLMKSSDSATVSDLMRIVMSHDAPRGCPESAMNRILQRRLSPDEFRGYIGIVRSDSSLTRVVAEGLSCGIATEYRPELIKMLDDENENVRQVAARGLVLNVNMYPEGARALVYSVQKLDLETRHMLPGAFYSIRGPENEPVLRVLLRDEDNGVRAQAAATLLEYGADLEPEIVAAFKGSQGRDRADLLSAIARKGKAAQELLPDIVPDLHCDNAEIRHWAVVAVGSIAGPKPETIEMLKQALKDPDDDVYEAAASMLNDFGQRGPDGLPFPIKRGDL